MREKCISFIVFHRVKFKTDSVAVTLSESLYASVAGWCWVIQFFDYALQPQAYERNKRAAPFTRLETRIRNRLHQHAWAMQSQATNIQMSYSDPTKTVILNYHLSNVPQIRDISFLLLGIRALALVISTLAHNLILANLQTFSTFEKKSACYEVTKIKQTDLQIFTGWCLMSGRFRFKLRT